MTDDDVAALRTYIRRHNGQANLSKWAASRGFSYAAIRKAAAGITHGAHVGTLFVKMPRPAKLKTSKPFKRRRDIPF
jgi:hypothetical protein